MRAPSYPESGRGPLITVFLTVFIDLLGFGIVIPLLPIYSKAFGANEMELGLLFASFSAMQFVFAPFWGRVSDRFGRRPVLVGGLLGTSISYVLFGLAGSMPMLFAARMLAGFFGANVATAQAYIADVSEARDRAKGMGMIGAAFGLGFTFGPLVGGELVSLSMAAPGYVAAFLSLAAAVFGFLRLPEPARHRGQASRLFGFETVNMAVRDGRIGLVLLLYFLAIFSFSGFESMFIRFGLARFPTVFGVGGSIEAAGMDQVLAAAPIAGRYMFFIGLMAAGIQGGLIRRLVPRFGETKLIVAGPVFLGLSFAVIGLASRWSVVILGCALMPFGFGINSPALTGLLSRAVPDERQGAFLGMNQSLGSLARVAGPLVAGAIFERVGPQGPFLDSALVLLVAALLAGAYRRRYGPSFEQQDVEPVPSV
jgi:DHA1 family tetracycline resistance protein-like MFS transporter